MALLLSDIVVCGHLSNRQRNAVRGWIKLRGFEHRIWISLTGNCAADLRGKSFYFEASDSSPIASTSSSVLEKLAPRQVGPVGTMTAIGRVQVANCSAEELLECQIVGIAPPLQWKSSLFLEWFGQDGRVIVELLDARITFVDALKDEFEMDEADDYLWDDAEVMEDDPDLEGDEDPYGLFPNDLAEQLAEESPGNDPFDFSNDLDEHLALINGDEVPLQILFDPPIKMYPADKLTDRQIEESLQVVLARLARHGVALDMCEHFTPRNAYRLLMEEILPNESIPAGLAESGFVQQYTTHEFCPICLLRFMEDEAPEDIEVDGPWDSSSGEDNIL